MSPTNISLACLPKLSAAYAGAARLGRAGWLRSGPALVSLAVASQDKAGLKPIPEDDFPKIF